MKKEKVVVGMSGGMDSSATAAMLVDQRYDVHGITLKVWNEEENPTRRWQERSCCKVGLARYVAKRLDIPHQVIDVQDTFRDAVIQDFVSGYMAGKTPNPCVRCNERIKFGLLYHVALDLGADYLATGHYVRIERDSDGRFHLKQAVDQTKDQSYFLYRLRPEFLPRLMFPLGSYQKSEVGKWIQALDLPPEELRESQEICFVTQGDYRKFLAQEAPEASRPGPFMTTNGDILGEHRGVAFYTIGQRRGLGISSPKNGERLYVLNIDPEADCVLVGAEDELYSSGLTAVDLNYLCPDIPPSGMEVGVRIRYRSPVIPAVLDISNHRSVTITFQEPQRAASPGQSVVFYRGDVVLGGGIIETVCPVKVPRFEVR